MIGNRSGAYFSGGKRTRDSMDASSSRNLQPFLMGQSAPRNSAQKRNRVSIGGTADSADWSSMLSFNTPTRPSRLASLRRRETFSGVPFSGCSTSAGVVTSPGFVLRDKSERQSVARALQILDSRKRLRELPQNDAPGAPAGVEGPSSTASPNSSSAAGFLTASNDNDGAPGRRSSFNRKRRRLTINGTLDAMRQEDVFASTSLREIARQANPSGSSLQKRIFTTCTDSTEAAAPSSKRLRPGASDEPPNGSLSRTESSSEGSSRRSHCGSLSGRLLERSSKIGATGSDSGRPSALIGSSQRRLLSYLSPAQVEARYARRSAASELARSQSCSNHSSASSSTRRFASLARPGGLNAQVTTGAQTDLSCNKSEVLQKSPAKEKEKEEGASSERLRAPPAGARSRHGPLSVADFVANLDRARGQSSKNGDSDNASDVSTSKAPSSSSDFQKRLEADGEARRNRLNRLRKLLSDVTREPVELSIPTSVPNSQPGPIAFASVPTTAPASITAPASTIAPVGGLPSVLSTLLAPSVNKAAAASAAGKATPTSVTAAVAPQKAPTLAGFNLAAALGPSSNQSSAVTTAGSTTSSASVTSSQFGAPGTAASKAPPAKALPGGGFVFSAPPAVSKPSLPSFALPSTNVSTAPSAPPSLATSLANSSTPASQTPLPAMASGAPKASLGGLGAAATSTVSTAPAAPNFAFGTASAAAKPSLPTAKTQPAGLPFGQAGPASRPEFAFGQKSATSSAVSTSVLGHVQAPGAKQSSGFSFGKAAPPAASASQSALPSGFSFGQQPAGGGFSFGQTQPAATSAPSGFALSQPQAAPNQSATTTAAFSFGQPAPPVVSTAASSGPTPGFSFGKAPPAPSTQAPTGFSFGQLQTTSAANAVPAAFSFGQTQPASSAQTTAIFSFGQSSAATSVAAPSATAAATAPAAAATATGFSFGQQQPAPASAAPLFSFGQQPQTTKSSVASMPAMSFGVAKPPAGAQESKAGAGITSIFPAAKAPTGAASSSGAVASNPFGAASGPFSFGPSAPKAAEEKAKPFSFAAVNSATSNPPPPPPAAASQSAFAFGLPASSAPSQTAQPSIFSTASTSATTTSIFSFGQAAAAPGTSLFGSQGSSATPAQSGQGGFAFGKPPQTAPAATAKAAAPSAGRFAFGAGGTSAPSVNGGPDANSTSSSGSGFAFGAAKTTAASGTSGAGMFAFGQADTAAKSQPAAAGGFSFGAAASTGAQQPASRGADPKSNPSAPAAPGFAFNRSATTAGPSAFQFGATPPAPPSMSNSQSAPAMAPFAFNASPAAPAGAGTNVFSQGATAPRKKISTLFRKRSTRK